MRGLGSTTIMSGFSSEFSDENILLIQVFTFIFDTCFFWLHW